MTQFEFKEPRILDEDLTMIREQVRRFVQTEVLPHGEQWEADGTVPREVFRRMGSLGFLGMRFPVEYGGSALGALSSTVLSEELGRSSFGGFTAAVTVHTDMSLSHIAKLDTPAQKQKYLPAACAGEKVGVVCVTEPQAGSDVAGMRTRAERDGTDWIINGAKLFITNGVHGDIYVIAARTEPDARGSKGVSLFIVDRGTPGLKVGRELSKHGWRSSDTAELYFDQMRVPADALLGEEGRGFYYIMSTFQNERLVLAAQCVGQCAKAIDVTTEYVKTRKAFGKTLWEQQVVRQKIAMLASKAAAARSLTYSCAQMLEEGQDAVREISMLKAFAAETLQEVVHGCLQLHGGMGYMIGTVIERMARDARIMTIGGGATEIMLEEVAKRM